VGCGRTAPKTELLRIALDVDGERARAIVDRDGTRPGRGAYLCRERIALVGADAGPGSAVVARSCLQRATRRRAIARALRSAAALDPELVESPEGGEAGPTPVRPAPLFFIEP
jgi:predicted RNA-binding protein YlxR (DUF448 family)